MNFIQGHLEKELNKGSNTLGFFSWMVWYIELLAPGFPRSLNMCCLPCNWETPQKWEYILLLLDCELFFYTGQWNVGKSRSMPCLNFRGIIYFCLPFWFLLSQEELPLGGCCSVTWAQGRTHWELTRAHTATRCHAYPAGSEVWSRAPAKPGLDQPTLDDPHKSEKWVIIYPEICSCLLCINNCLMIILICVKKKNSPPKKLYRFNAIQIKVVKVSF